MDKSVLTYAMMSDQVNNKKPSDEVCDLSESLKIEWLLLDVY